MLNYDLLKQKIQEVIPRLLEMSKGQLFTIKNMPFHYEFLHFIYNDDEEIVEIATLYNGEVDVFDYEYFTNQHITIYGKEPMLNDVLFWLNNQDNANILSIMRFNDTFKWDLSNPYLKDQSSELIEWLNTLG
jgi:3-dehydroquinate dehydratase